MNGRTARLIRQAASKAGVHARPLRDGWAVLDARAKDRMRRDLARYVDGGAGTTFGAMVADQKRREAAASMTARSKPKAKRPGLNMAARRKLRARVKEDKAAARRAKR